ncbi:MAG: hypothetical protein M3680_17880 [Myxococcota bacterium]|nr:hypothetical protein [Myxococcota bacterium]
MRNSHFFAVLAVGVLACGTDDGSGRGDGAKGKSGKQVPPPIAVTVTKLEHSELLAPNQTYADQSLGAKPADGKIFSCVFYKVVNTSAKELRVPMPVVVDDAGARTQLDITATSRIPSEWPQDATRDKLAPGKAASRIDCFELPKPGAAGMKLLFEDTGWGPKNPPWELVTTLA